ncbi:MAG: hypothetical protein NC818_02600 [Candidatus Omnitrophica bacterium]|nr:hypothetical protein [Candidatus Omnitrophota bacterium]
MKKNKKKWEKPKVKEMKLRRGISLYLCDKFPQTAPYHDICASDFS